MNSFHMKMIEMGEDATDIGSTESSSKQMSRGSLGRFIKKNKESGLDTLSYEVDYYEKYSFPFIGLVLSLLSIPFSVKHNRSGSGMAGIGLCIGFSSVFWVLLKSSLIIGKHGVVPPYVAAWAPHFTVALVSLYLISKRVKS